LSSHNELGMDKIAVKRLSYTHGGKVIYEWEQTLDEINIYVKPPPGVTAKMLSCEITSKSLTLGLASNEPFLSEKFEAYVNSNESTWYALPADRVLC
jgi:hypothetical protein